MRKAFLLICLIIGLACLQKVHAQSYDDVLNYNLNGTPTNGVKIKTNLPFQSGVEMPTIIIEGYNYSGAAAIGLTIVWYIFNGVFCYYSASSWGSYTPPIYLSDDSGLVSIFIQDKPYFQRFKVMAYAHGMSESSTWFQGWSVVDEPLAGTNQVLVPYKNSFAGTVGITGNLNVTNSATIGTLGVGTGSPSQKIDVADGNILIEKNNGSTGEYDILTRGINTWKLRSDATNNDPQFQIINNSTPFLDIDAGTGNVLIGKTSQTNTSYKLDVNGNIRANQVTVNATGADYVFNPNYNLPSLDSLSEYIRVHHHLSGIPSAKEMQKDGMNVGEAYTKLLQKVEEMTIYLVKLQNEVNELKTENNLLRKTK